MNPMISIYLWLQVAYKAILSFFRGDEKKPSP